jgi:glycosyltransferase involved in cell wall biosynthesis
MGRAHEFDTILNAIEILKSYNDIAFLFIGDGAKRQWLESQAKQRKLDNIIFKPYQDFSKLSYSLSVGDVHLISLIPELEGLIVPSKLYGVMAAGRPSLFVGSDEGEIKRILAESNCGRSTLIGEADNLANEIITLYKDKELLYQISKNARSEYMKKYDKPVALQNWQSLLSDAVTN